MATYAFPTLTTITGGCPMEFSGWRHLSNSRTFNSVLTNAAQAVEVPGGRWKFSARFTNLRDPDRAELQAFLQRLDGQANWFTVHEWSRPNVRGAALSTPGTPIVVAAGSSGKTLNISGAPASVTNYLLPGDLIGINTAPNFEVRSIAAAVSTNGSGAATLTLGQAMRKVPPNASAVVLVKPAATFCLTSPEAGGENIRPGPGGRPFQDFVIDAIEMWQP